MTVPDEACAHGTCSDSSKNWPGPSGLLEGFGLKSGGSIHPRTAQFHHGSERGKMSALALRRLIERDSSAN